MPSRRTQATQLIETTGDIARGLRVLRRRCPLIRRMHDIAGDPPLRRRAPGLEGLARIIVGQQVSVASAAAIWGRTAATIDPFDAPGIAGATDEALRAAGLSTGKVRTLRALAGAINEGRLSLAALDHASDEEVHDALTALPGIGPWTVDVYLLFCLGRADSFAAGDLALQVALQLIEERDRRPSPAELLETAERWRPWRGVAARLLWDYYRVAKASRSGMPV